MTRTTAMTRPIVEEEILDEVLNIKETDSVIPIIPSPMMIRLRAPIRSTMFVSLNVIESLKGSKQEMMRSTAASATLVIYLLQR